MRNGEVVAVDEPDEEAEEDGGADALAERARDVRDAPTNDLTPLSDLNTTDEEGDAK